jgi:hypothetical protein
MARLTSAYKAGTSPSYRSSVKGFSVICRYVGWKEVQKHIAMRQERLMTIVPIA